MATDETIRAGLARIPYAREVSLPGHAPRPAGWVLPGGIRTHDRTQAYEAALQIDAFLQGRTRGVEGHS